MASPQQGKIIRRRKPAPNPFFTPIQKKRVAKAASDQLNNKTVMPTQEYDKGLDFEDEALQKLAEGMGTARPKVAFDKSSSPADFDDRDSSLHGRKMMGVKLATKSSSSKGDATPLVLDVSGEEGVDVVKAGVGVVKASVREGKGGDGETMGSGDEKTEGIDEKMGDVAEGEGAIDEEKGDLIVE